MVENTIRFIREANLDELTAELEKHGMKFVPNTLNREYFDGPCYSFVANWENTSSVGLQTLSFPCFQADEQVMDRLEYEFVVDVPGVRANEPGQFALLLRKDAA